jgi:hypothetical protein
MNDTQLAMEMVDLFEEPGILIGNQVQTGIEILKVHGNRIFTVNSINDNAVNWQNGVVEVVQSNTAKRMRMVVVSAEGNEIVLTRSFSNRKSPQTGDIVKLSGGPLAEAVIYFGQPDTLTADIEDNKKFFVTVSPEEGDINVRGFGGRDRQTEGLVNAETTYGFEVTAESLLETGEIGDREEAYKASVDFPTLREQVITILYRMRFQEVSRIYAPSGIGWVNVTWERAGGALLKASVIQFDVMHL